MRRSAESWQFILPVIATISIISILLACAQDLTGPATENRNSGAQPTDLALRGARGSNRASRFKFRPLSRIDGLQHRRS